MIGTQVRGRVLRHVEKWAISFAAKHGFQVLGPMTDRHGSLEITFRRRNSSSDDDCERLVGLGFTELPVPLGTSKIYEAQVWAGAEMSDRFTKRVTSEFRISEDAIKTPESLQHCLATRLERGFQIADQLMPTDFDKVHVLPRNAGL